MATLQTLRIPVQAIALLAGLTGVALVSAGILMSRKHLSLTFNDLL